MWCGNGPAIGPDHRRWLASGRLAFQSDVASANRHCLHRGALSPAEFFADLAVVVEERFEFLRLVLQRHLEDCQRLLGVGEGGLVLLLSGAPYRPTVTPT